MILKKPVFVLGAGASAPYGFPLGGTLVEQIYRQLETSSALLIRVDEMGYPISALHRFRDELAEAARGLDAFLEKRQDYLDVGKACIAAALIPFEDESELAIVRSTAQVDEEQHSAAVLERRSRRWYHYLFDHMLTGSFEDNQLAVVTFNFDRSFERALYRVLRANFKGAEENIKRLCASVPIVHIHGRLGAPDWLEPDTAGARPYNGSDLTAQQLQACANENRLVTDEIDQASQ